MRSGSGTFETCPPIVRMSVHPGRPEVAAVRPNRREGPVTDIRLERLSPAAPSDVFGKCPTFSIYSSAGSGLSCVRGTLRAASTFPMYLCADLGFYR